MECSMARRRMRAICRYYREKPQLNIFAFKCQLHYSYILVPYLHQFSAVEYISTIWDKFALYFKHHNEKGARTAPSNDAIWNEFSEQHKHQKIYIFDA